MAIFSDFSEHVQNLIDDISFLVDEAISKFTLSDYGPLNGYELQKCECIADFNGLLLPSLYRAFLEPWYSCADVAFVFKF